MDPPDVNLTTLLSGVFCLIGGGFSVVAGRHFARRLAFLRSSAVSSGIIIALREERDGQETQRYRYPKVRFQTASGRELTFESGMARSGDAWQIGETVSVRYRPDHPEVAEFNTLAALWGPTVLFALLAVVFLGLGAALWLGFVPA